MNDMTVKAQVEGYLVYLKEEERSEATQKQYKRDICRFLEFLGVRKLEKEIVIQYKRVLEAELKPSSVNAKLAALNGFFSFIKREDVKVKLVKIQRKVYCSAEKELTKNEYLRLIRTAKKLKNDRLALLLQTICGTGIRVSELKFITAEAVKKGEAVIQLKGKTRVLLLSGKLQKILKDYLNKKKIRTGPVFVTRTGRTIDRSNIWKMMKALCKEANVEAQKVFPHNLRHLFARTFYAMDKDIAKLADIMGHSSINTTRIYIISSGWEHRQCMDALGLVV